MAELVDAADSKSAVHQDVRVRVSPRAPLLILWKSILASSCGIFSVVHLFSVLSQSQRTVISSVTFATSGLALENSIDVMINIANAEITNIFLREHIAGRISIDF